MNDMTTPDQTALRRTVTFVAIANLAYFLVEAVAAHLTGSASLFADSVDFLEDGAANILILVALRWTLVWRTRAAFGMCLIMVIPAIAFVWTVIEKFLTGIPPQANGMSLAAFGALVINLACAFALARHRAQKGALVKAAVMSARNDALANIAILVAAGITFLWPVIWPDLVAGVLIAWLNLDAAAEVWRAARTEQATEAAA